MKLKRKFFIILSISIALLITIPVLLFLWFLLGGWLIPTIIIFLITSLIILSYIKDISIPVIEKILRKEYFRVKFSLANKPNRTKLNKLYLKLLFLTALLFQSSIHSYELIKEELLDKFTKKVNKTNTEDNHLNQVKQTLTKLKQGETLNKEETSQLETYLFQFNKFKQKRTTFFSVACLSAFLIVTLISSLILPAFSVKAATYNWLQDTWTGGADTTETGIADHTNDQTDWSKYYSKDDNVSATTDLSLTATSTTIIETTDAHFNEGTTSDTVVSGNSVAMETAAAGEEIDFGDATPIYRSVGPSNTSDMNVNSRTVTISGDTATFSGAMPDNMGVGDVLVYNSDTNIAFIHGRTSETVYTVKNAAGGTPTACSGAVKVYRAYTSLQNAENGVENTGIPDGVENFDTWTNGRDIVTNNEYWNIACYGDAIDIITSSVSVSREWKLQDVDHYLRVYTPYKSSEVGISQRHDGKWNSNAYTLQGVDMSGLIFFESGSVKIDGLQISYNSTGSGEKSGISMDSIYSESVSYISNNIIRGTGVGGYFGIRTHNNYGNSGTIKIFNNIIYDGYLSGFSYSGIYLNSNFTSYVYNNTVYNMTRGLDSNSSNTFVKNNIIVNNYNNDYYGAFSTSSTNNISSDATYPGTDNARINTTIEDISFVDAVNKDFHITSSSVAKDAGADLSADANLAFTTDIDGDIRGASWDIGADEVNGISLPTTGTFTSQPLNTTVNSSFDTIAWNESKPSGTNITIKVRSSNNSDMSGATDWGSCSAVTNGADISGGCVTDTDQYIQYQATLTTSDTSVTPSLNDVTINYSATENGRLTSSIFNSEASTNILGGLVWTEDASLPAGSTVSLYLRTASTEGGITSAEWSTAITNATSGCTKNSTTVTCTATAIPAGLKDGSGGKFTSEMQFFNNNYTSLPGKFQEFF